MCVQGGGKRYVSTLTRAPLFRLGLGSDTGPSLSLTSGIPFRCCWFHVINVLSLSSEFACVFLCFFVSFFRFSPVLGMSTSQPGTKETSKWRRI